MTSFSTRKYDMTVPQGGVFCFHIEYEGVNLDSYGASFRVARTSEDLSEGLKLLDLRGVTAQLETGLPPDTEFVALASTADAGFTSANGIVGQGGIILNVTREGFTGSGTTTGGILMIADSETMKNVPHGSHQYTLDVSSGAGSTVSLLAGEFEVKREIVE
tara:strand:- start:101 stop:583 length:483 start_codon:yes stop_codon:yes gene_type:complete